MSKQSNVVSIYLSIVSDDWMTAKEEPPPLCHDISSLLVQVLSPYMCFFHLCTAELCRSIFQMVSLVQTLSFAQIYVFHQLRSSSS